MIKTKIDPTSNETGDYKAYSKDESNDSLI
jgi:hypothetical protein